MSDDRPTRVIRARDWQWEGVPRREYKTEGTHFRGVTRQTLLGEGAGETALDCETRYFEVAPGGYTSLEQHRHPHSVVILRGHGEVILDDRLEPVAPHDVVYIGPWAAHQFHAAADEPLGFLCVVSRDRDRPQLADDETVARIARNPDVAARLRR